MKQSKKTLFIGIVLALLALSSCSGYISGDLKTEESSNTIRVSDTTTEKEYSIHFATNARPYSEYRGFKKSLSGWTFGIIPTYTKHTIWSQAMIVKDRDTLWNKRYRSKLYQYHGILWQFLLPVLPLHEKGMLASNEGSGVMIISEVTDRTVNRAIRESGLTLDSSNAVIISDK